MPLPSTKLLLVLAVGLSAGACRGVSTLDASDMVRVPEGEFQAGGGYDYEQSQPIPVAHVFVAEFLIDKFEVTVSAYRACVTSGSCSVSELNILDGEGIVNAPFVGGGDPIYGPFLPTDTCTWSASGNDTLPLNCVTWNEAGIFCRWAGKRLPSGL